MFSAVAQVSLLASTMLHLFFFNLCRLTKPFNEDDEEEVVSSDSVSDVGDQFPGQTVARDPYSDS